MGESLLHVIKTARILADFRVFLQPQRFEISGDNVLFTLTPQFDFAF